MCNHFYSWNIGVKNNLFCLVKSLTLLQRMVGNEDEKIKHIHLFVITHAYISCFQPYNRQCYSVADLRRRPLGAMAPLREETAINMAPKLLL